jgi:branched-chain amino acid transport system substrate-binding protein
MVAVLGSIAATPVTAASATTEPPAAPDAEGKVTDFLGYVGGPGGAASGDPIRIGYITQDGGAIVVSSTHDDGVNFAAQFINEQAGGIGGRPIEIVPCVIANTEEEGQQCGQQFANDDSIAAVISGPTVIGTQAFYSALAESKAVVHGVSVNPVDTTQPNVAVLNGGAVYILAPFATFAQEVLGVESAALTYSEETQSDAAAGQASAFETLGIPIEVAPYSQNAPDYTVPLLAAGAQDVDVVMPVLAAPECVKWAEAQRALEIPDEQVLASPVCLNQGTIEGLGDFPEWYYGITTSLGTDASDPAVPPYQEYLTEIGQEQHLPDPWVLVGFGQAMTLAKWLNAIGPDNITTDAILEQMAAFEGPLILGSPVVDCGKYPEAPGNCGDHTQFFRYVDGALTNVSGFLPPPEGWESPLA